MQEFNNYDHMNLDQLTDLVLDTSVLLHEAKQDLVNLRHLRHVKKTSITRFEDTYSIILRGECNYNGDDLRERACIFLRSLQRQYIVVCTRIDTMQRNIIGLENTIQQLNHAILIYPQDNLLSSSDEQEQEQEELWEEYQACAYYPGEIISTEDEKTCPICYTYEATLICNMCKQKAYCDRCMHKWAVSQQIPSVHFPSCGLCRSTTEYEHAYGSYTRIKK